MQTYDLVVIGAGPGGYVAAIRAAQLGLTTACIDKWVDPQGNPSLGGTCLNVGCIPSKALLDTSHHYHNIAHLFPAHGISVTGAQVDIPAMQARKSKVVTNLTKGITGLMKKNKVDSISGIARFISDHEIEITPPDGRAHTVSARNVIIATGSVPVTIPAAAVDQQSIVDSEGALDFNAAPERLGIIGAGVIGLELGSVWNRLGSKVTILEAMDDFLTAADRDIAGPALRAFKKQGLNIQLGAKVTAAKVDSKKSGSVMVTYEIGGGSQSIEVDKLVVAVGRKPYSEGLNLDAAGVRLDPQGRIAIDECCRTAVPSIYAIGDCVAGPMLAHKASEEGVAVAELIAGQSAHIDHRIIPWVTYTHPEIAWVGSTEQALKAEGVAYRKGAFPFAASGRAQGAGDTEGRVKILSDAETDEILGVHIFGAQASELIAEAVTAMAFSASSEDLARIVHAHPTLSEAVHEAALAVDDRAIHF